MDYRNQFSFQGQDGLVGVWSPAFLIGGAWLWLFWPILLGISVVGFRDSTYLYYPLFEWIDNQWAAGHVPLWNPYDGFGQPVIADGSSSVFYPGKLIFCLRFLPYPIRYGAYIALHVLLAAAGAYRCAQVIGCPRSGATLAAIAFAFGGSVLFQTTNVVYLVGAAWLPWALACIWLLLARGVWCWGMFGGACCALMTLGGDPQMAYHVLLIAGASMIGHWGLRFWRRESINRLGIIRNGGSVATAERTVGLALLVASTCLLSAIQLLPSLVWSRQSERSYYELPRNVYEVSEYARRGENNLSKAVWQGLFGTPVVNTHHDHIYQFSQPPWSLAELFWPNISGRPFPTHARLAAALPGADRVWTPSLYMGCLTVLLALFSLRLWGRYRRQVWLTWIALFFGAGSFGWYGLAWLRCELAGADSAGFGIGPQVGGVYWLMVCLLPKYVMFRYPAKLFVVASLAICLLAGLSVGKPFRISRQSVNFGLTILLAASFLAVTIVCTPLTDRILSQIAADNYFGPFDKSGAIRQLIAAFLQPVTVCACYWCVWRWCQNSRSRSPVLGSVIPVLVLIDILVANYWLVPQVSKSAFTDPLAVGLREPIVKSLPQRRYNTETKLPRQWRQSGSRDRLAEIVRWQRASLFPKHHLNANLAMVHSFSSINPIEYMGWQAITARADRKVVDEWLLLETSTSPQTVVVRVAQHPGSTSSSRSPSQYAQLLNDLFSHDWIQAAEGGNVLGDEGLIGRSAITFFEPNHVRLEINAPKPMWLCLSELWDPQWRAEITDLDSRTTRPVTVCRWRGLFRCVPIDPGKQQIDFYYCYGWVGIGAWISGLSWAFFLALGAGLRLSRHFFRLRDIPTKKIPIKCS